MQKILLSRTLQDTVDAEKAAWDAAILAVRSMIYANGGAAVALLTFLGTSEKIKLVADIAMVAQAIALFTNGLFVGLVAMGALCLRQQILTRYWGMISSNNYREFVGALPRVRPWAVRSQILLVSLYSIIVILLVAISLYCFYAGCHAAVASFLSTAEHFTPYPVSEE